MKFKRDILTKYILLKRSFIFWILGIIDFYVLAFADNKSLFIMENYEQTIYRYNFQQVFIIFTCVFIIHILLNENELVLLENYKIIYTKNIRQEINSYFWSCMSMIVILFWSGQILSFLVNIILGGEICIKLFIVNLIIVSIQIIAVTLFVMGLRMLFIKDIVIYGVYYVTILVSLISGNVYFSIPLTINIVGIQEQGYYVTFGYALWIGRVISIFIGMIVYILGVKKFERENNRCNL